MLLVHPTSSWCQARRSLANNKAIVKENLFTIQMFPTQYTYITITFHLPKEYNDDDNNLYVTILLSGFFIYEYYD